MDTWGKQMSESAEKIQKNVAMKHGGSWGHHGYHAMEDSPRSSGPRENGARVKEK